MNNFFINFSQAMRSISRRKRKSILAILGFLIGISATVVIASISSGVKEKTIDQIKSMGSNMIVVTAGQLKVMGNRAHQVGNVTTLKPFDYTMLRKDLPNAKVAATQQKSFTVKFSDYSAQTTIIGATPSLFSVRGYTVSMGREFTSREDRLRERVAIIGRTVIQNLNAVPEQLLGATIIINTTPFRVIGIQDPVGIDIGGQDEDNQIIIPLDTALDRLLNVTYINNIYISAPQEYLMSSYKDEAIRILRQNHNLTSSQENDFTVQDQSDIIAAQTKSTQTLDNLTVALAMIAVFIGGLGIAAVLLVAVKERTKEIGVRKSFGATKKDILTQFFIEAAILSGSGTIFGILIGLLITFIITIFTKMPFVVPFNILIPLIFVAFLMGVIFGTIPAKKAAEVDPIRAIYS
ncbi:ABC transporter permease [Thermodesulfobium sp. 4217-1]|uniref:ABC transporter permease n=1 Tax=Thermodesulfobium sp. 4217-1 TaxID=3120013 RepID=UPI0032219B86